MDPFVYLKLLRRRWYVVAAVTAVALLAAWVTLPEQDGAAAAPASSYRATHTLLQSAEANDDVNRDLVALYATTGQIPRLAAEKLGRPAEEGPLLSSQVQVANDPTVPAMRITSVGPDAEEVTAVANAFGEAIKAWLQASEARRLSERAQFLQGELDRISGELDVLASDPRRGTARAALVAAEEAAIANDYQATFELLRSVQGTQPTSALDTLEAAVPIPVVATGNPVPTSRTGRLGLALVLGLLLGVALIVLLDRLDTRVRRREEVEEVSGLPVVAEVPRLNREARRTQQVLTAVEPDGGVAESYRALRSALLLVPARPLLPPDQLPPLDLATWQPPRVVLVVSGSPAEGKTSTTTNLATALAESGRRVVVLDADFRKPAANAYLGVPRGPGLSDLLAGKVAGGLPSVLRETLVPDVSLITSGTSDRHPAALLSRVGSIIDAAKEVSDVVLIDSAPLLVANDATDLVPHVDALVVVTQAGRTGKPQLARTTELLTRLGVPVLGVVLQASPDAQDSAAAGYYGAGESRTDIPPTRAVHQPADDRPALTEETV